jgi:hypothetical protein
MKLFVILLPPGSYTNIRQSMSRKRIIVIALVCIICIQDAFGQNNRLNTHNRIGWYNYFGSYNISKKFGLHSEYQWRRNQLIREGQQSLLRIGLNYHLNPRVLFRLGYAWVETYPYGDYPINGMGRDFTEHRFFEMIQLAHKEGILDLSHRFMLEQRFVGRYSSDKQTREDLFPLSHRFRYMLRIQVPLNDRELKNKTAYVAAYNEVFIGFGKNVQANVFDQNRLGIVLGYQWSKNLRLEGGYLHQTLQLGRQIMDQNVFQYNNGIILNAHFNLSKNNKLP